MAMTIFYDVVVHCADCATEWRPAMPTTKVTLARGATLLAGVAAMGCPLCGAWGPKVLCGPAPKTKKADDQSEPYLEERRYT